MKTPHFGVPQPVCSVWLKALTTPPGRCSVMSPQGHSSTPSCLLPSGTPVVWAGSPCALHCWCAPNGGPAASHLPAHRRRTPASGRSRACGAGRGGQGTSTRDRAVVRPQGGGRTSLASAGEKKAARLGACADPVVFPHPHLEKAGCPPASLSYCPRLSFRNLLPSGSSPEEPARRDTRGLQALPSQRGLNSEISESLYFRCQNILFTPKGPRPQE